MWQEQLQKGQVFIEPYIFGICGLDIALAVFTVKPTAFNQPTQFMTIHDDVVIL
jgi:hypothetical protein